MNLNSGVAQIEERGSHTPQVTGASPVPATKWRNGQVSEGTQLISERCVGANPTSSTGRPDGCWIDHLSVLPLGGVAQSGESAVLIRQMSKVQILFPLRNN